MERIPVQSSTLASVGYDPESQVLEIEFKSGSVYEYFEVPMSVHRALLNAPSLGKFFNQHILDFYPFQQII